MTLICFASQKGSPGATATALAVAASLKVADGRRKLLLEADSTGGTLAIRYQLPVEPGLLTLAAAARTEISSADLWRHARELPGGLPVVLSPDGPEQVNAAMAASGAQLGRFLSSLRDVDVICDVGRLAPDSPALAFVAEASAVLMVARPTAEQLQPAARRMTMLKKQVGNIGWVLIGQKPYGPAEVEATYDFPVVGVIADDPRSVASFENGVVTKRLRRHPFIRSATTLAKTLSDWLAPITSTPEPAPVSTPTSSASPPTPPPTSSASPPTPPPTPSSAAQAAPPDPPAAEPIRQTSPPQQPAAALRPVAPPDLGGADVAEPEPGEQIEMDLGPQVSLEPAPQTRRPMSIAPAIDDTQLDAGLQSPGPHDQDRDPTKHSAGDHAPFTVTADLHTVFSRPSDEDDQAAPAARPSDQTREPGDDESDDPDWMAG